MTRSSPAQLAALVCAAAAMTCAAPQEPLGKAGQIQGTLQLPSGARGDGFVFLYAAGEGPPLREAAPLFATAVSDVRVSQGDTSYVLAQVPPNPYHLWAFLDVDRSFQPTIDVLAQPGAGDRTSEGADLNLEPGQHASVDLPVMDAVALEPPAFHVAGIADDAAVSIPDQLGAVTAFTLQSDDLGLLAPGRVGFSVSLPDAGDPNAVANPLGVPALYPQIFLRFVPKPGQIVPTDARGNPADVVVPLAFDPAAYLVELGGDTSKSVLATQLTAVVIPQAQAITYPPGAPRAVAALSAIPVGDYELWVLQKSGQFWRIPNDLGTSVAASLGGPFGSQGLHFSVVHGSGADGGP